ncbi:AAA ATPase domain-containing protein [Fusarium heterosporum]|uniref:AAA ATPase domain-containing protein n=1 Tax=Fusarium heterosporum TaxID=42747 RepID=A0A8H5TJG2_FUSHE|nr:AAA ATPase domain-containing protein [Fusarium heterosporum]
MPLRSKYSVRVSLIPKETTDKEYDDYVRTLLTNEEEKKSKSFLFKKFTKRLSPASAPQHYETRPGSSMETRATLLVANLPLCVSMARQRDFRIGTITVPTSTNTIDVVTQKKKLKDSGFTGWNLSDNFEGITVLYEYRHSEQVEMDICVVHGLGGNAMDTWTSEGGTMWPRDYLKSSEYFEKSRVMSFGYDSDLTDRKSTMTLEDWAEALLRSVDEVRVSDKVVTSGSASLDAEEPAYVIMGTNHNSICKFSAQFGPYITITAGIQEVYAELMGKSANGQGQENHVRAPPTDEEDESPSENGKGKETGEKTELLIRFVLTQKYRRNVFFIRANEFGSLEDALADVCSSIGSDLIENPKSSGAQWRQTSIAERIQIFVSWLGHDCNKDSILVMDGAEIFSPASIQNALRIPAWHIIMSTRNSKLRGADREIRDIRLRPLDEHDTILLLKNAFRNSEHDDETLITEADYQSLARVIAGHPTAAHNLVPFLLEYLGTSLNPSQEFVKTFTSGSLTERKVFFDFAPHGTSLWNIFHSSLEQLKTYDDAESAIKLFQLLPYLCTDQEHVDGFLKLSRKGLGPPSASMKETTVLRSEYLVVSQWLQRLQDVSLYVTMSTRRPRTLDIHPLVLEFAQIITDHEVQRRNIKEVLQVLYDTYDTYKLEIMPQILPHIKHCLGLCSQIGLSLNSLDLSPCVSAWLKSDYSASRRPDLPSELVTPVIEIPLSLMEPGRSAKVQHFIDLCERAQEQVGDFNNRCLPSHAEPFVVSLVIFDQPCQFCKVLRFDYSSFGSEVRTTVDGTPFVNFGEIIEKRAHREDTLPGLPELEKTAFAGRVFCQILRHDFITAWKSIEENSEGEEGKKKTTRVMAMNLETFPKVKVTTMKPKGMLVVVKEIATAKPLRKANRTWNQRMTPTVMIKERRAQKIVVDLLAPALPEIPRRASLIIKGAIYELRDHDIGDARPQRPWLHTLYMFFKTAGDGKMRDYSNIRNKNKLQASTINIK